jgi:hypothetical protein
VPSDLLADLAERGITVTIQPKGDLGYRGKRSALTPQVLDLLRQHKAAITESLTRPAASTSAGDQSDGDDGRRRPSPRSATASLSISRTLHETPPGCFGPVACRHLGVCGRLDCLPSAIRPTVANLLALSSDDWSAYAAELASAPDGDPWLDHDAAAFRWATAIRAGRSTANPHRPLDVSALGEEQ